MAATVTLAQILTQVLERSPLGYHIPAYTGTTTTLTSTTSYLLNPGSGAGLPVKSPILIISTTGLGEKTFVSGYRPDTGVITVLPAITTGSSAALLLYVQDDPFWHFDRVTEAVEWAMTNKVSRWERRPLTFVPDGDLQGVTVTDYWTASAFGTAAYAAAQVYPAGSAADAVGQVGLNRVLQLTSDASGGATLTGNGIRVVSSSQMRTWYFQTAIRLVSGSGIASFSIRDNTNSADISLQVTRGNDSQTLTTADFGDFMLVEGTFQLPATCAEVAPRLTVDSASMVAQMGPLIMYPAGASQFPMPNRIRANEHIGNFYYGHVSQSPAGLPMVSFSDPLTVGGATHWLNDYGDHRTVTFNFHPQRQVWYDERVFAPALSVLTDTTTFPIDQIVKWTRYELYNYLMEKAEPKRKANEVNPWLRLRNASLRAAQGASYEPELVNVSGRR